MKNQLKFVPKTQNGSINVEVVDGIASIKINLPKEKTDNLTAYVSEQFIRMLVFLQTMEFDEIIDKAIIKAGFREENERLADIIVNAKSKILYPEPDPIPPEGPERLNADEPFEERGIN